MASNRDVFRPWEIPVDISAAQPAQSAAVPAAVPCANGNADGDKCSQALHPYLPKFLSCVKAHGRDSTSSKLDLAKQNDLLFEAIFDATGTLLYHEACVLRIFGISKGRLRRIQERRMGLRDNHHGLVGRRSNNSKKPETQQQFVEFVRTRILQNNNGESETLGHRSGNRLDSVRAQFNAMQMRHTVAGDPRETISRGTTQSWFRMFFSENGDDTGHGILAAAQTAKSVDSTPRVSQQSRCSSGNSSVASDLSPQFSAQAACPGPSPQIHSSQPAAPHMHHHQQQQQNHRQQPSQQQHSPPMRRVYPAAPHAGDQHRGYSAYPAAVIGSPDMELVAPHSRSHMPIHISDARFPTAWARGSSSGSSSSQRPQMSPSSTFKMGREPANQRFAPHARPVSPRQFPSYSEPHAQHQQPHADGQGAWGASPHAKWVRYSAQ